MSAATWARMSTSASARRTSTTSRYVARGVDETAKIHAQVNLTEAMGSEVFAYIESGGKEFIGRLDPRTSARTGQNLEIVLDMDKMHIFDRENQKALV